MGQASSLPQNSCECQQNTEPHAATRTTNRLRHPLLLPPNAASGSSSNRRNTVVDSLCKYVPAGTLAYSCLHHFVPSSHEHEQYGTTAWMGELVYRQRDGTIAREGCCFGGIVQAHEGAGSTYQCLMLVFAIKSACVRVPSVARM